MTGRAAAVATRKRATRGAGDPAHSSNPPAVNGQAAAQTPVAGRAAEANEWFRQIAQWVSNAAGAAWAALGAFVFVLAWLGSGPFFRYSDHWQLIINTSTTIVTFLMVFLIQNAQNRDARAIHLKLDELIRGVSGARNTLLNVEDCTDEELDRLRAEFERVRKQSPAPPSAAVVPTDQSQPQQPRGGEYRAVKSTGPSQPRHGG
jgi:low affinity Fe/Cu permease